MNNPAQTIVILGGGMTKNTDGSFITTNYNEPGDRSGVCGDRLRVEAGNYLFQEDSNRNIIASGGQGLMQIGEHPNISSVIKKELIDLGVPSEKIIEEDQTNNTYQQLKIFKKLFTANNINNVIFITNRWHMDRTKAMIEYNEEFKDFYKTIKIDYQIAEDVAIKYNKDKWQKMIEEAYRSPDMMKRLKLEEQGLKQVKEGTYQYE